MQDLATTMNTFFVNSTTSVLKQFDQDLVLLNGLTVFSSHGGFVISFSSSSVFMPSKSSFLRVAISVSSVSKFFPDHCTNAVLSHEALTTA